MNLSTVELCLSGMSPALKLLQNDVVLVESCQFRIACAKFVLYEILLHKKKGKAVPLWAWSGPEGSRNLRFPDFITTAQDGGKVSLMHQPP